MARRVNTKFVIFLVAAVVVAGAGFAAIVLLVQRQSAADHVRNYEQQVAEAVEAEAAGDIERAIDARSRAATYLIDALGKERSLDLFGKRIENNLAVPSRNSTEANEWLGRARQVGALTLGEYDDEAASDLVFDMLRDHAERLGGANPWLLVAREARERLKSVPNDGRAKLELAVASAQTLNTDVAEIERQEARQAIADALEAELNNPDARLAQAQWASVEVARLSSGLAGADAARRDRIEEQKADFTRMVDGTNPGELTAWQALFRARLMLQADMGRVDDGARALVELAQDPERFNGRPRQASIAVNQLLGLSISRELNVDPIIPNGVELAESLARNRIDAEPDLIAHRLALGRVLQQRREFELAAEQFEAGLALERPRPPVDKLIEASDVLQTRYTLIANTLQRAQTAENRQAMLERAEQMITDFRAISPQNRAIRLLEGEIAYLRQDFTRAAQLLATGDLSNVEPRILFMIADALDRSGQRSLATRRYAALVTAFSSLEPTHPARRAVINKAAQAALLDNNFQMVLRLIEPLSSLEEPPEGTLEIQAAALIGLERYDQARELLEKPGFSPLSAAFQRAEIFRKTGNPKAAQQLLADLFESNPDNRSLLTRLLDVTEDPELRERYIATAESAGLPTVITEALRTRSAGDELSLDQRARLARQRQPDEVTGRVVEAQVFSLGGDIDRGRELFQRVEREHPEHRAVLLAGVDYAIFDQDYDRAERYANAAGQRNLDGANGQILLAKVQTERGQLDDAIVTLNQALEINPVSTDGRRQLANLYMRTGRNDQAVGQYRQLLRANARDTRALLGLSRVLTQLGRQEEALDELRRAVDRFDEDRRLRELYLTLERQYGTERRFLDRREAFAKKYPEDTGNIRSLAVTLAKRGEQQQSLQAIERLPEPSERSLRDAVAHAYVLTQAGDREGAERVLFTHMQDHEESDNIQVSVLAARVLSNLGEIDLALKALDRAAPHEDRLTLALTRERADILVTANRMAEAEPVLRTLYSNYPRETAIRDTLARALFTLGRADEAKQLLNAGDMTLTAALFQIADLVSKRQPEQALAVAEQAVPLFPDSALLLARRAGLYAGQGRFDSAQADIAKALELNPRSVEARMIRAELWARDDRFSEALGELRLIIDENPQRVDARRQMASLLVRTGDRAAAWRELEAAGQNDPENPLWPIQAGQLAKQVGDARNALRLFEKAVEIRAVPDTVGAVAKLLLEQEDYARADAFLAEHPDVVNTAPMIQALRAWALFGMDRTEQGRNLMTDAMRRIAPYDRQRRDVLRSATGMLGATAAADLTIPAASEALKPVILLEAAAMTDDPAEALALADRGLEVPNLPAQVRRMLMGTRAIQLTALDRTEDAVAVYRAILEEDANDIGAVNNLAYLLVDLNRPQEALQLAEQAAAARPFTPEILDTLGAARMANGNLSGAIDALEKAQARWRERIDGGNVDSLIRLGDAYLRAGRDRDALPVLTEAEKIATQQGDEDKAQEAARLLRAVELR
ncbi:MAG: tetratricopeptide repeat protein [Planctomycetota bacterium]